MNLSGQRIVVIGASGFIGQHVLTDLVEAQANVRAVDIVHHPVLDISRVEWLLGDVSDKSFVSAVVTGCDTVIFLATRSLPATANNNMSAELKSHVEATVAAAETSLAQGVERFLFASSGGTVYGGAHADPISEDFAKAPRNAYGVSKLATEHYLRLLRELHGFKTLSLRIANPYGPQQRSRGMQGFISAAMEHAFSGKTLPIWGDGSVVRDYIYVGDVASAFVKGCSYDGQLSEMNIGSGQGHTLLEIVSAVETAVGLPLKVDFQPSRKIDVPVNVLDITRAKEELDWKPTTNLEAGLAHTANWWRQLKLG